MSVSRSEVSALALRPSSESLFQRTEGARTTPAATTPSTSAVSSRLPRSLKARTRSPLRIPASLGVARMQVQHRGLPVDARAIAEGRVHAVVVLRRNHFQWIAFLQLRVAETRFDRRLVIEMLRAELAFSRWCAESAFRERQKRLGEIQANGMLAIQALERNAFEERMTGRRAARESCRLPTRGSRHLRIPCVRLARGKRRRLSAFRPALPIPGARAAHDNVRKRDTDPCVPGTWSTAAECRRDPPYRSETVPGPP